MDVTGIPRIIIAVDCKWITAFKTSGDVMLSRDLNESGSYILLERQSVVAQKDLRNFDH